MMTDDDYWGIWDAAALPPPLARGRPAGRIGPGCSSSRWIRDCMVSDQIRYMTRSIIVESIIRLWVIISSSDIGIHFMLIDW